MKLIKTLNTICPSCMKRHDLQIVEEQEDHIFKGEEVSCVETFYYCGETDEMFSDGPMMNANSLSMKDAYRAKMGLLTSDEIIAIRRQYGITQEDLSRVMGWGLKTITRYETCQVQDEAYDTLLKEIRDNPKLFIARLNKSKDSLSPQSYEKYLRNAEGLYGRLEDSYGKDRIFSKIARYAHNPDATGNTQPSVDKAVDMIRYFANHVKNLFKVKLMKMMWYADAVSYKRKDHSISGLVYIALPYGAVPIGYSDLIEMRGITTELVNLGEDYGTRFVPNEYKTYPHLTDEDIAILNAVIECFGMMSTQQIVDRMHSEQAYIQTQPNEVILFPLAKSLSIS